MTKAETEKDEDSKYGMIFHIPQSEVTRINFIYKSLSITNKKERNLNNLLLPTGFQPFMRCHMQYSYGIKVTKEYDLRQDVNFEKLRFRHNEELSRKAYNLMKKGDLIYPHDGLAAFGDIICQIKMASEFSEQAFEYAYKNNNYYKNKEDCRKLIQSTIVNGKKVVLRKDLHPFEVSRQRRRQLDREYRNFSIEEAYNIKLQTRTSFV